MDTRAVASELVKLCKQNQFLETVNKLYADDVVSIEPVEYRDLAKKTVGIAEVRKKNQSWIENHEIHEIRINGPFLADDHDQFAVLFYLDITSKIDGRRILDSEIGLYSVKDGKIVQEQFFYNASTNSPEG